MIPCSALFKESSRYGRGVTMQAYVTRGGQVLTPNQPLPLTEASWSSDLDSNVRTTANFQLRMDKDEQEDSKINVETARVRFSVGITTLGYREMVDVGEFRIDELNRTGKTTLELSCSGLEAYIVDARFPMPRTPPYGSPTTLAIKDLINEVLPGAQVVFEVSNDKRVQLRAPWEKERIDAIRALADSINAQVFADYRRVFVIRDVPSSFATPVFRINEGEGGVVIDTNRKQTRDRVYNAAVVRSTSSDPDVPPFFGMAVDDDPTSPTWFYGDFGQVPRFFSSQFFTSDAQCLATAQEQLVSALVANKTTSASCLLLPFLEVGDSILLDTVEKVTEQHQISKISASMSAEGGAAEMNFETKSSKETDIPESDLAPAT